MWPLLSARFRRSAETTWVSAMPRKLGMVFHLDGRRGGPSLGKRESVAQGRRAGIPDTALAETRRHLI
jgi:hypothetical protein